VEVGGRRVEGGGVVVQGFRSVGMLGRNLREGERVPLPPSSQLDSLTPRFPPTGVPRS